MGLLEEIEVIEKRSERLKASTVEKNKQTAEIYNKLNRTAKRDFRLAIFALVFSVLSLAYIIISDLI